MYKLRNGDMNRGGAAVYNLRYMRHKILISRSGVMSIVEGITATIAQHNAGTVSFEQLWASAGDSAKLDIWWRQATGDLESTLRKHVDEATGQFDLMRRGDDYTITLRLPRYFDRRVSGLLSNKVQEYMVNAVTAGWLSDFTGLTTPDYTSMAAGALSEIVEIVLTKAFGFSDSARTADEFKAAGTTAVPQSTRRAVDGVKAAGTTAVPQSTRRNVDNARVVKHEPETDWGRGVKRLMINDER